MIRYHASWVLPIAEPPLRDGWIAVDRERVAAYGAYGAVTRRAAAHAESHEVDLGRVAVLPGLVNAHTHLELSYLRDQVLPAPDFPTWIRRVMAARRQRPSPRAPEILDAMALAIEEAEAFGTAVVGDISNTLVSFAPLARSRLAGVVFFELLGFDVTNPVDLVAHARRELASLGPADRVRTSLAAHAPHTVAPLVLRAIHQSLEGDPFAPCSVHLAESVEEVEFIRTGEGPWRRLLEEAGVWNAAWSAPGVSPVQFLDDAGFLDRRLLVVHGVQMTTEDLSRIASHGATLVTCPRSNGHTGAGAPPIGDFYSSGARIAVGTDSLASAPDLSVFAELATLRALAPSVPASRLLASATVEGARALGFDADYGTIEPGKSARLLAIDIPGDVGDVEEYLVSGVSQEQIRWIGSET
ncbi:MAG TPA: amidohydrolase family protein [Vicinamibacterales bacterium]|nr:amidohydrolase family protein [Vicinamibacterales bacterium]